jgi:glycosyltransferase involved in cell wall biosynthesis
MYPKVSVVIPTYKRSSEFLERALTSVLNQTYKNLEVIVVDDNSLEPLFRKETESVIERFNNDERVKYIQNKTNLGGSLARNEGIFQSNGEYITFLDDDDIYLQNKVERQINFMVNNSYDMTFTELRIHNEEDKLIDYREYKFIKEFSNNNLLKYHIMRHITGTPTFMYKKEVLKEIKGFVDAKMGQEFYLMLNTIENNYKIGYLEHSDVIAYAHKGEKISRGKNKIEGEKKLYQFKKKYFSKFSLRQRMFIRFRHHAVMVVAGLRASMFMLSIKHTLLSILASPLDALIEPFRYLKKIVVYNK